MADKIANDIAGALNEELDISEDKINNSTIQISNITMNSPET